MTTITATVLKENDVKVIKDTLDRLGIEYTVDEQSAVSYGFSAEQIADLERTQRDYLSAKTTARDWDDIKRKLDRVYLGH